MTDIAHPVVSQYDYLHLVTTTGSHRPLDETAVLYIEFEQALILNFIIRVRYTKQYSQENQSSIDEINSPRLIEV